MFYRGQLDIDPSQTTQLKRRRPTKVFAKLLHWMTAGLSSEREEFETFTAVSVLQSLNLALRRVAIDNIMRLAMDENIVYRDDAGRADDLSLAMAAFLDQSAASGLFENLTLVLEHDDRTLRYLIQVQVFRRHAPGDAPIVVRINALDSQLDSPTTQSVEELRQRMIVHFSSRSSYRARVEGLERHFHGFLASLEAAIRAELEVDAVATSLRKCIVRPRRALAERRVMEPRPESEEPLFHGYDGFAQASLFLWLWSELCHAQQIWVDDTWLVDEDGRAILTVGPEGVDAGTTTAFDPTQAFTAAQGNDVVMHAGHAFASELDPVTPARADNGFTPERSQQLSRRRDPELSGMIESFLCRSNLNAPSRSGSGLHDCGPASNCSDCSSCGGD